MLRTGYLELMLQKTSEVSEIWENTDGNLYPPYCQMDEERKSMLKKSKLIVISIEELILY